MSAELTRFSDHQRVSIDTAANSVRMQIEALQERHNVLAERIYSRTSECLGQHTETQSTVKSLELAVQNTGQILQQQVYADFNSILTEVHREVQGLHSKMDDVIVQKPVVTGRLIENQQVNINESLAIVS